MREITSAEFNKAISGMPYNANDKELVLARLKCKDICFRYNNTLPSDITLRHEILIDLFGSIGVNPVVEQPFYCDYGINIKAGDNLYINHNCVILDCAEVVFGDNVFIAPNCGFYTASHPLDSRTRNSGLEYAKPIHVGNNVWVCAGASVLPGVSIGDGSVIGAGSIVKDSIPPDVLAVGNPCVVVKRIK